MRHDDTPHNERREWRRARLRRSGALAAALACLVVLAACGGGSSSSATAAGSPRGSGRSSMLAYSQCMRAHGIKDFPDPSSQGGISVNGNQGGDLDPNNPRFKAADQACRKLLPGSNLSPAQAAANQARAIRFSRCMRAHGVPDFPDPNGQGGLAIKAQPGSDLDPNNPRYKAASTACQHLMPGGGTGGSVQTSGPGGGS